MDATKLCLRFKQATKSLAVTEFELIKFGGSTSQFATMLIVSERFLGQDLPKRLQLVYEILDANDPSLRRDVDFTFILLTSEERANWEDYSQENSVESEQKIQKIAKEASPE